eukprot:1188239-Pyramimonas_sp.AAC.1
MHSGCAPRAARPSTPRRTRDQPPAALSGAKNRLCLASASFGVPAARANATCSLYSCLLYTSDAADDTPCVDL